MESFVINCPWCRKDSEFEVENLARVAIPGLHVELDAEDVFDEVEKKYPVYNCQNSDCLAPFQAVIAKGIETAKTLEKVLSRLAWSSPRRFHLPRNKGGDRYEDMFGVLFNRTPLAHRKEIRLSSLVDVPIIAEFLSAHAWRFGSPVTLFEAWGTEVGQRTYWIPLQPLGSPDQGASLEIGTSPHYRPECRDCRRIFEAIAVDTLRSDPNIRRNCPHYDCCPANRACLTEPWTAPNISDRCLRWLELRQQDNPCWQSDLAIIEAMSSEFQRGNVTPTKPYQAECWCKYREIAFPLVVHNHLVGAVMIGQFDSDKSSDTEESPRTADDFVARERQWRRSRQGRQDVPSRLANHMDDLRRSLAKSGEANAPAHQLTEEQDRAIRKDVMYLATLTEERYLRHRDLLESAFRSELAGMLTLRLLKRQEFEEFLPYLLGRMRDFWAFRHVCLCMMGDAEDYPTLHSTDARYIPDPKPILDVPELAKRVREYGSQDVLLGAAVTDSPQLRVWRDFFTRLAESIPEIGPVMRTLAIVIGVHAGQRSYVFCFFGRDTSQLSQLPYAPGRMIRVSRESREQAMKTCEQVAGQLHNFWARHDQEVAYRVLSHSLRTPVTLMKKGTGRLRRILDVHRDSIQLHHPDLYDAAQQLCESLRLGSEQVDDDLRSLGAVANLESFLEKAKAGMTDLVVLLHDLARQYSWRSRVNSRVTERALTWDFRLPNAAFVRGHVDAIGLAVRNVLDNAFKYSFPGRLVTVEVLPAPEPCELVVRSAGVLVDPDELGMVWQRDYRGRNARKRITKAEEGTGYGLFIVKQIVEATGGRVSMETQDLGHDAGRTTVRLLFVPVKEK